MNTWLPTVAAIIGATVASSGFWAFIMRRDVTKKAIYKLLLGLAYDKIATLGMHYIERGWISRDEFEEFYNNLYLPYKEFGGNGVAEQIMVQVSNLPLRRHNVYTEIAQSRRTQEEMHQNG